MSINPVRHPLYLALIVDLIVTLVVDAQRGLLDFSITSVFWVHLTNFPIWIVVVTFATCAFIRSVIDSQCFKLLYHYFRYSKNRERQSAVHELSLQRPRLTTDVDDIWVATINSATERNTATPRLRQGEFA